MMWILENQGPSLPGELGYLLAVAKMFSGFSTASIIGSAAVFLNSKLIEAHRHTEYYPEQ